MKVFRITLPWPPSVNDYWENRAILASRGKQRAFVQTYIGNRGREFRESVVKLIEKKFPNIKPTSCRLAYRITLCAPTRRKCDLSNFVKAIEDALQHAGLFLDDEQFDTTILRRGPIVSGGCALVEIWKHEKQPPETKSLFGKE